MADDCKGLRCEIPHCDGPCLDLRFERDVFVANTAFEDDTSERED